MRAAEASRPAALPASTPNAAHNPASSPAADDDDIESGANDRLRLKYRGRRCPRWRLRGGDASTGAKSKARSSRKELMYDDDGGAPFERCANTKDGVAVWMRAVPGSNAKEVLAEATFAKTPAHLFWRAVCDVERYQEFVPFVKRSFVCKDARSSAGSGSVWVYNVVKAPVVGPRDFVIKTESAPRGGADGSMTCAWHVPDDGVGPAALSGHVRLLKNSGGWELRETANGKGVAVRYRVLTDPGTALPGFLVDLANQSSVPDVMRAFNARATSGVYEREDAAKDAGSGSSRFLAGLVNGGVAKELEELLQWGDFGRITTSLSARLRKMATALDARGGDSQGSANDA